MRKFLAFALCLSVLLPLAGCAKKSASEELGDEMRKVNKEAGRGQSCLNMVGASR